ncbi:amino acid ABC transporter [Lelliottia aquatilis]|uniref:Amino acid ABC transporter n=1 Tax=Lelliottia aquatilis TaxID=2080838 RepID=A0ABX5A6A3_9ENTR|nr:amino acid ABC transporter [Lelliottia aquatilis]POZ34152.1 amino acid ABC transporter [Lelliottia sp. 7254-16]POZ28730.1 amino acid ABC transporter [Lelliottia aquatilis]POZ33618.1 amino acid ABC transporter [Lelliottia aquatilis]POZ34686.1 amino acid ABC transporter [Lelliottia aquatilis]
MHACKTLRKIPRLSVIHHFYALMRNNYSGFGPFITGSQWKRNLA